MSPWWSLRKRRRRGLLDRHGLREVPRLVDVAPSELRDVVREQLQRWGHDHRRDDRCRLLQDQPGREDDQGLEGSAHGGRTWAARPALNLAQNSPQGFQSYAPATIFSLTSDGATLATVLNFEGPVALYR